MNHFWQIEDGTNHYFCNLHPKYKRLSEFSCNSTTSATNTVLKAFPLTANDAILVTNWTYQAVAVTACVTADRVRGICVSVHLTVISVT